MLTEEEPEENLYVKVPMAQIMELYRFCNRHAQNNCENCPMKSFKDDWTQKCMISETICNPIHKYEE
jgi:hypothetical protein